MSFDSLLTADIRKIVEETKKIKKKLKYLGLKKQKKNQ